MNEVVADAQRHQMEAQLQEQLEGMRVDHNVPVDHDLFRLFFEALNPNMNVNELNDDDVAALQEQMNEILEGNVLVHPNENEEGEWQQDWNSDEEYRVCYKQRTHPASWRRSARGSSAASRSRGSGRRGCSTTSPTASPPCRSSTRDFLYLRPRGRSSRGSARR